MKKRKRSDFVIHDKSLSHINIDILLEHKLKLLENTQVISYQISDDATKADLIVFCPTSNLGGVVKNLVLLNALDISKFMQPGLMALVIASATRDAESVYGLKDNTLKNLSFIIPICDVSGNWAVAFLSCISIDRLQYSLKYINSATVANPKIRNADYDSVYNTLANLPILKDFNLANLAKLDILEDLDLSCNQQNYSKGSPPGPSGLILIDNIVRLCTARPLVDARFYTAQYKSELLADNATTLQEAWALHSKPPTEADAGAGDYEHGVVAHKAKDDKFLIDPIAKHNSEMYKLLIQSDKFINYYLSNTCTPHLSNNPEKIKYKLSLLCDAIKDNIADLNVMMSSEEFSCQDQLYAEFYSNIGNILKLQHNWSVIWAARLQFFVQELQFHRHKSRADNAIKYFFEILPDAVKRINKKDLEKFPALENIYQRYKEYLDNESTILSYTMQNLTDKTSIIKDFFVNAKTIFAAVRPILQLYKSQKLFAMGFRDADISEQVGEHIKLCNDVCLQIEIFVTESERIFNLKNPIVEQLLLKEEQKMAEKKKAEQDKKLQNVARDVVFKSAMKQKFKPSTNSNNEAEQEPSPEQKIDNICAAYKNSINCIKQVSDLQNQVEKISTLEAKVIARGWTLSVTQKLDLAECLVLSVFFAHNMIDDIKTLEPLQQKILALCLDAKQSTLDDHLKANTIVADLFSIYANVLHKKCACKKYKLVDYDARGRPIIVITPEVAKEKFMLFVLYKETMQQLNTYVKAANEVLAELIHPQNPDGLEWSLRQYTQCQDEYVLTLALLEEEEELARLQRKYYEDYIKPNLIGKRPLNKTRSNASVVQSLLKDGIFDPLKINQMKQFGSQCAKSIELINRTFKAKTKPTKNNISLAYLDGMTHSYARSRSKSFDQTMLEEDAGPDIVVRPRFHSFY